MNEDDVLDLLRGVSDPDLGDDVVSLGLVNDVTVTDEADDETGDPVVRISLALGAPYSPHETRIADRVREVLSEHDLAADLAAEVDRQSEAEVLPGVKNVVAVASGKGGVGKTTVAVNLAVGLAELGARVGLFDADVYGPNVPQMLDARDPPQATAEETLVPPEAHGAKLMSMGYLVGEDDPVIWRGPMVHKALTQLFEDVEWGALDYMVVDLPPGTGDTQLTLLQTVPVTGAVVVTTPQAVALDDARKGLEMFGEHDTPVLGIVENMSTFRCPDCGGEHDIFGAGGGRAFAEQTDMPFLGALPLDPVVRTGDAPAVLGDGETADAFRVMTENVANNVGVITRRRQS